ncbi:unnamed protein product [Allacma fusca]|uniref:NB-ARC domain-containing protein n=1 Tax=Allacma fusca TaxID=39272 RepID=A0A8J2KRM7_9HEXA|nr:unnamed protein product [Allacma fusca]
MKLMHRQNASSVMAIEGGTIQTTSISANVINGHNSNIFQVENHQEPVTKMNLINKPVSYFIGREDLVARIQLAFPRKTKIRPQIVVLYGLGGIGKTELAKYYTNDMVRK